MMTNKYVSKANNLVTTHESQRNGFLEYALRKSKESIPYIDKAKALKVVLEQNTKKPKDILKLKEEKLECYQAAGVSVKATKFLGEDDLNSILLEFIKEFLEPAGSQYIEELIYRYLLTLEIFTQYSTKQLANCANLTVENQLISLCNWLVKLQ